MINNRSLPLLLVCMLLVPCLSSSEYSWTQDVRDTTQHEAGVTLKLIQVFVSDKDGSPVMDLTIDDFIVTDNGQAVKITEFEIHRIQSPDAENAPEAEGSKTKPESRASLPQGMNRKFYLILDGYRNDGLGLKKARKTAQYFIDTQVLPEDELGLLSYSIGRGLVTHEPLTTDHAKIREAVGKVKLFPGITSTGDGGATAMEEALDFAEFMNDFALSLRYIPGYKHIMLFSAGLPRALFGSGDPRLLYEFERLSKELASSSCPIYTVDTQGARDLVQGREQKGDDSLRRLAGMTGGSHFPNVDYKEDISRDIQNSTGNYYILGYTINEELDGKYHEIKVKTKRKGLQVQAQKGYYNPKRFSKLTKLEKRLHLIDLARNPSPRYALPKDMASYSIPWPLRRSDTVLQLTEVFIADREEIFSHKAEYFSLIYDEEGALVEEGKKEVNYTENPPSRIVTYSISRLAPGKYEIITILRNTQTGASAKAAGTIEIPEEGSPADSSGGIVLFLPGDDSPCLRVETDPVKGKSKTKDLRLESLVPDGIGSVTPLVLELRRNNLPVYAVFDLKAGDGNLLDSAVSSRLRSMTTKDLFPVVVGKRDQSKRGGEEALTIELTLPDTPPGRYMLEISFSGDHRETDRTYSREILVR